jgi:hypothetical protein
MILLNEAPAGNGVRGSTRQPEFLKFDRDGQRRTAL